MEENGVMTFEEAIERLEALINYERTGLSRITTLEPYFSFLRSIGDPQTKVPNPILIAGTKGKGSTAHFIFSILRSAGLSVGLYTSPHLTSWRERIEVDGKKISEDDFARLIPLPRGGGGFRTVFETITALAFLYFIERGVDCSVLEVGLGGRLDATNVVEPLVSVITQLGLDHTAILGNTVEEIAKEKAGVMYTGVPVVCLQGEGFCVLERRSYEVSAPLVPVPLVEDVCVEWDGTSFVFEGQRFKTRMRGAHQAQNACCAIVASKIWAERRGLSLGLAPIQEGVESAYIPGRIDVLRRNPLFLVDGSHNPASVKALVDFLERVGGVPQPVFVFSCLKNKDVAGMARVIGEMAEEVWVVPIDSPRAESVDVIRDVFLALGLPVRTVGCLEEALLKLKDRNVVVCGSLYLAGEALRWFSQV